jgi:opacity protein-like surface antigen
MSNATTVICWLVVAALATPAASAAQRAALSYALGAGVTLPRGDFHADDRGDGYNRGWEGLGLVELTLPHTELGVRLDGTYGENSANDRLKAAVSSLAGSPADSKTKILGASFDLTYGLTPASRARIYVLAGGGIYNFRQLVTSSTATLDTSTTKFAWNAGAGLSYTLARAGLFVEVRYVDILAPFSGSDIKYVPIIAGVRFGGR